MSAHQARKCTTCRTVRLGSHFTNPLTNRCIFCTEKTLDAQLKRSDFDLRTLQETLRHQTEELRRLRDSHATLKHQAETHRRLKTQTEELRQLKIDHAPLQVQCRELRWALGGLETLIRGLGDSVNRRMDALERAREIDEPPRYSPR